MAPDCPGRCWKYPNRCLSGLAGTSEGTQAHPSLPLGGDRQLSGFFLHTFCKRELTTYQGSCPTMVGSECWKYFSYPEICLTVTRYH